MVSPTPGAEGHSRPQATISVIIPTRNGAETLRELLAGLRLQERQPDEIIVIDSASTDTTVHVAHEYGATVVPIPLAEFDHGGTRTLGATIARGELLVFFTQDALPAGRHLLARLVAPFDADEAIGMSYGRQLPAFDADLLAAHLRQFNYPEQSAVRSFADRTRCGLGTVFASNSCAAYRREVLAEVGYFPKGLIFGEDTWVAGKVLQRGRKIAYVAEAAVYHSHNYQPYEEMQRYFDIGVLHRSESWLIETYGSSTGRGLTYLRSGLLYLRQQGSPGAMGDFMVRVALKWIGYQLGRRHRILPRSLAERLSLHKNWWVEPSGR